MKPLLFLIIESKYDASLLKMYNILKRSVFYVLFLDQRIYLICQKLSPICRTVKIRGANSYLALFIDLTSQA